MEEYMGVVKLFAGSYVPEKFMACDGTLLPIAQNQALFAILGNAYGGDGRQTFGLPKLAAPAAGLRFIICTEGIFPARSS